MPTVTVRVVVNQDDDEHASSVTSVRVIAQWLDNGITTGSHDDDLINTNDTNANNTRSIR